MSSALLATYEATAFPRTAAHKPKQATVKYVMDGSIYGFPVRYLPTSASASASATHFRTGALVAC